VFSYYKYYNKNKDGAMMGPEIMVDRSR